MRSTSHRTRSLIILMLILMGLAGLPIRATASNEQARLLITTTPSATHTHTATATPTATVTRLPLFKESVGVYKDGTFYIYFNSSFYPPPRTIVTTFGGDPSDLPVVGDWAGDDREEIGVYRSSVGVFHLLQSTNPTPVVIAFVFGNPGDKPLAGRWESGRPYSGVGVYRSSNGVFYLKNELTSGVSDYFGIFGNPDDQAVAGRWNTGVPDSVGVYRASNGTWYLSSNTQPSGIIFSDISFVWDIGAALPLVGDWDDNGTTTPGSYNAGTGVFTLHSDNAANGTDNAFSFGPTGGLPFAGQWESRVDGRPPMQVLIGNGSGGTNPNAGDNTD
jgi:hypothetical protein